MKATKHKELIKSKDNKKMKKSTSPYLKYSFTEFSNDNKNLKGNTLSKNETTKHIKQKSRKNITNILCFSKTSNLKKRNVSINLKRNYDSISDDQSISNLIKLINNEKILPKKKLKKSQKLKVTVSNDFSFSNITPSNIEDEKNNKENIINSNFNYNNLKTNTCSKVNLNKNNPFLDKENKNNLNSNDKKRNENLSEMFNLLNEKLKTKLNENKSNKNKRFNSLQKIFEELILIIPEENKNIFNTILIGIHDIITEYYLELKNLKEEYEENKKQLIKLENDNIYNIKLIKQKDLEIEKLKKKISCSMTTQEQQIISKSTNSSFVISLSTEKEKSNDRKNRFYFKSQNKIEELNKKNIFDLNALYFNDKIRMKSDFYSIPKSNNGYLIPPLNLDFEKIKDDKNDIKEGNNNNIQKNKNKLSFIQKVALSFDLN